MSPVDPAKFKTVDEISVELSSRRTGMSFQRTRMSADRTLMSVIRTSLSLISFGFTIFQVFTNWLKNPDAPLAREAPRNFGIALVMVGILLLMAGIAYHVRYMTGVARRAHADDRRRPDPRTKRVSDFAHADLRGGAAGHRLAGGRQHGVRRPSIRLGPPRRPRNESAHSPRTDRIARRMRIDTGRHGRPRSVRRLLALPHLLLGAGTADHQPAGEAAHHRGHRCAHGGEGIHATGRQRRHRARRQRGDQPEADARHVLHRHRHGRMGVGAGVGVWRHGQFDHAREHLHRRHARARHVRYLDEEGGVARRGQRHGARFAGEDRDRGEQPRSTRCSPASRRARPRNECAARDANHERGDARRHGVDPRTHVPHGIGPSLSGGSAGASRERRWVLDRCIAR